MNPKQTIWTVIGASSLLVGYRALREGYDPIPQWAGIGASGMILLFLAEPLPKFAASLAALMGLTLVLNYKNVPTAPTKYVGPRDLANPTRATGPR